MKLRMAIINRSKHLGMWPILFFYFFGFHCGCNNLDSTTPESEDALLGYHLTTIDKQFMQFERQNLISAHRLDDEDFNMRVAVSLKSQIGGDSVVLSYKRPNIADYVEILRCAENTILSTGVNPVKLSDLTVSGYSEEEKQKIFLQSDFFQAASKEESCELISSGTVDEDFLDNFSPTGRYVWLLRACLAPERLLGQDNLTTRNCSRRVAISQGLSYTNFFLEEDREERRQIALHGSQIDQLSLRVRDISSMLQKEVSLCEEQEKRRVVDTKTKNAILTLISVPIEVAYEIKSAAHIIRKNKEAVGQKISSSSITPSVIMSHYSNNPIDFMQLLSAFGGMSLIQMFQFLATSSNDIPRSCAPALRLGQQLSAVFKEISTESLYYAYYTMLVEEPGNTEIAPTQ